MLATAYLRARSHHVASDKPAYPAALLWAHRQIFTAPDSADALCNHAPPSLVVDLDAAHQLASLNASDFSVSQQEVLKRALHAALDSIQLAQAKASPSIGTVSRTASVNTEHGHVHK